MRLGVLTCQVDGLCTLRPAVSLETRWPDKKSVRKYRCFVMNVACQPGMLAMDGAVAQNVIYVHGTRRQPWLPSGGFSCPVEEECPMTELARTVEGFADSACFPVDIVAARDLLATAGEQGGPILT